jgi:hypothetical protein
MFPENKTHDIVLEPEDYIDQLTKQLNKTYELVRQTAEYRVDKQKFFMIGEFVVSNTKSAIELCCIKERKRNKSLVN